MDLTLALALHRLIAGDRSFAWSPYSVASALGVVAEGARGETRAELSAVLGDLSALASSLSAGAAPGSSPGSTVTLGVANTLWADLTLPVAADYLAAVKSWPGGAARGADFRGGAEAARQEINADVSRSTRALIDDLVQPGLVDADTRAVVVNALYLKAAWTAPFSAATPQVFHAPDGDVEVPTMHTTRQLPYAAGDGWTFVSIPAGEGIVADVLLPDGALAPLDPTVLTSLRGSARQREVALSLPRTKVRGSASLVAPLSALGIRRLFSEEADLTGVTGGREGLRVDAAVHKAVLTLDESGLEGAAATAVMMTRLAAVTTPPRPIPVRVDRPFHLLIRHAPTRTLHFLTQVTDPR